jgi:hypothetical protein
LASSIGFVLILLGGFVMAIAYGMVVQCQAVGMNSNCWDLRASGVFGFYIGTIITLVGATILVGPAVARLLGRSPGHGSDAVD